MTPTLLAGDILLLRSRLAKTGDIVVVNHATYGTIVKRINANGLLSGDSPISTSDAELGPYDPTTLIGVAIIKITTTGIRRLPARRSGSRASD